MLSLKEGGKGDIIERHNEGLPINSVAVRGEVALKGGNLIFDKRGNRRELSSLLQFGLRLPIRAWDGGTRAFQNRGCGGSGGRVSGSAQSPGKNAYRL